MNEYYSQCGQDKFLNENIFKGKRQGIFVDIGANDGITLSNTYFFEKELEWKGICFEPIPAVFERLQKNRTSTNINACAADEDKVDFFLSVEGYGEMLSGLKSKYDARHLERVNETIKEHGGNVKESQVQCYDINKVLSKYAVSEIDFISIDTEGNELEILNAINFNSVHVKAITVENNYQSPEFNIFLATKGFIKVKRLEMDEVYINRRDFNFFRRLQISFS